MRSIELSEKIKTYIEKVEKETHKRVKIEYTDFIPQIDIACAAHIPDTNCIPIKISINCISGKPKHEIDRILAHEATHGYLIHKEGYSYIKCKKETNKNKWAAVGVLTSIFDDIVVDKIIQEEGFPPSSVYFTDLENRVINLNNGSEFTTSEGAPWDYRLVALQHVIAWRCSKYLNLEPANKKIVKKFLKAFEARYPIYKQRAVETESIILNNDVFTAEGNLKGKKEALNLWELSDIAELSFI